MVYLYYISCLRYTILVGNPRYENGKHILIKKAKLYSAMCYFLTACMLSSDFKAALIFYGFFFHNLYKSPSIIQLSREAIGQ